MFAVVVFMVLWFLSGVVTALMFGKIAHEAQKSYPVVGDRSHIRLVK